MSAARIAFAAAAALSPLAGLFAQAFDIEQFPQLFRPQLKVDLRHQPETAFRDTTGTFTSTEGAGVFTFPLHSRFELGIKLDTAARGISDLLKNSVRIKASQVVGSVRFGVRDQSLGFDVDPSRQVYTAAIGATGLKLTRRYRVLFWSTTAYVSEETATMDDLVPRFNAVLGRMKVKGVRRQFFYGLALGYSDQLVLPVPFLGGNAPLGRKWSFQYTLPAQLAIGYKPRSHTKIMIGCALDGSRNGAQWHDMRVNLNRAMVRTFLNVRHTAGRHVQVRAELGYVVDDRIQFTQTAVDPARYPINGGFAVNVGVNLLFGGSVAERLLEEVLR